MSYIDKIKALVEFFFFEMNGGKALLFLNLKRIFKVTMVYYDKIDGEKAFAISMF